MCDTCDTDGEFRNCRCTECEECGERVCPSCQHISTMYHIWPGEDDEDNEEEL